MMLRVAVDDGDGVLRTVGHETRLPSGEQTTFHGSAPVVRCPPTPTVVSTAALNVPQAGSSILMTGRSRPPRWPRRHTDRWVSARCFAVRADRDFGEARVVVRTDDADAVVGGIDGPDELVVGRDGDGTRTRTGTGVAGQKNKGAGRHRGRRAAPRRRWEYGDEDVLMTNQVAPRRGAVDARQ